VQVRHCALVILRFYKAYLKRKQAKVRLLKKKKNYFLYKKNKKIKKLLKKIFSIYKYILFIDE